VAFRQWGTDALSERAKLLLADTRWEYAFYPSDLAWAPDGQTLLVCGVMVDVENSPVPSESTLATWVVSASGAHLRDEPRCEGSRVAFAPDGNEVAVGAPVRVVPVVSGTGRTLGEGGARCLAWSPDGAFLAVDREDRVVVLEPGSGREVSALECGEKPIRATWSFDGTRLAVGCAGDQVRVFDRTGTLQRTVEAAKGWARWSPAADRLAVLAPDRRAVSILDPASGASEVTIRGHAGVVQCLCWSPDGLRLATGASDRTIRVWSAETGHQVLRIDQVDAEQLAWSPGGSALAALCEESGKYSSLLRLWDMPAANAPGTSRWAQASGVPGVRWLETGPVDRVVFAGPHLITAHTEGLRAWDPETGREHWGRPGAPSPRTLAWLEDDRLFHAVAGRVQVIRGSDGADLGAIGLALADNPRSFLSGAGIFADGALLYTVSATLEQSVLQVWDLERGAQCWRTDTTESHHVAARGDRLAVATYHRLHVVLGCSSDILWSAEVDFPWGLAFAPDGRALALARSGTLTLYGEDGHIRWCREHDYDSANLVAWSPDGRSVAWTADWGKAVWIHDAERGDAAVALEGPTAETVALEWSPRGDLIASASRDQGVRLFTPEGRLVSWVEYPEDHPEALAWSADGRLLASTDAGGMLLVWEVPQNGN